MPSRGTIFISHGNPEDNEIAGWLAARLTGAGYKVWIDLWHDKGHPTWEEIEEEIRTNAGRVVALVSKTGASKPGFKDEINAASGVRRHLGDIGFIIPIRLDDISFQSEVPSRPKDGVATLAYDAGIHEAVQRATPYGCHPLRFIMDGRVKPGHDERWVLAKRTREFRKLVLAERTRELVLAKRTRDLRQVAWAVRFQLRCLSMDRRSREFGIPRK